MENIDNRFRVGVDIGGTFTDVVFLNKSGRVITRKIPSTPDNYTKGIVNGLEEVFHFAELSGSNIAEVIHGCTVATNAVLEHKGSPCALITTKGFRDVLEIRRLRMPEMYNYNWSKPTPLVPRELRFEVNERIDAKGDIIYPLDMQEVETIVGHIVSNGINSIAVCLLNSHVNPIHEKKIGEIIRQKYPHVFINLSCEIIPLMGEYERSSEAVVNAYVRPVVDNYLRLLADTLRDIGIETPLLLMRSDGGMMSFEMGAKKPIYIIECGPAAGVIGCAYLARKINISNIICLDMGGTTTKASIIEDNKIKPAPAYEVGAGISIGSRLSEGGGHIIRVSSVDIAEIGAGGGSKIWIDAGGGLHVGPVSTGAIPGPACYDNGGEEPTLTDTNLVLGYLNPEYLTGGTFKLNASRSWEVLEKIAKQLGKDTTEIAYGTYMIAVSNMIRAIRAVTTERGRDPRDFILFAYGGAGPMHAAVIARELDIERVVVTPNPGLFSSFGLLFAQVEHRLVRNFFRRLDKEAVNYANEIWKQLINEAISELEAGGYSRDNIVIDRFAELRYTGQSTELIIPIPWSDFKEENIPDLLEAFHDEHLRTYAHKRLGEPITIANLGVSAKVLTEDIYPQSIQQIAMKSKDLKKRKAYFGGKYGWLDTSVLRMEEITEQHQKGPAIIELYDSTCVIPPYCQFSLGPWETINIKLDKKGEQ